MCVLIFCTTFVWNISHSKKNWGRLKMSIGPHVKYLLFLSNFNDTNFLNIFLKNTWIWNFMKISPVGAKLFYVDGQTWRSA